MGTSANIGPLMETPSQLKSHVAPRHIRGIPAVPLMLSRILLAIHSVIFVFSRNHKASMETECNQSGYSGWAVCDDDMVPHL